MKLTKKHLKALIQEELDNIGEGFRTDRKAATKTAGKDLGMNKTVLQKNHRAADPHRKRSYQARKGKRACGQQLLTLQAKVVLTPLNTLILTNLIKI